MVTNSDFAFKIAAKLLQIETRHRSIQWYHCQSCHNVRFNQNASVTYGRQTDRRHIVPKARPNGRPKNRLRTINIIEVKGLAITLMRSFRLQCRGL